MLLLSTQISYGQFELYPNMNPFNKSIIKKCTDTCASSTWSKGGYNKEITCYNSNGSSYPAKIRVKYLWRKNTCVVPVYNEFIIDSIFADNSYKNCMGSNWLDSVLVDATYQIMWGLFSKNRILSVGQCDTLMRGINAACMKSTDTEYLYAGQLDDDYIGCNPGDIFNFTSIVTPCDSICCKVKYAICKVAEPNGRRMEMLHWAQVYKIQDESPMSIICNNFPNPATCIYSCAALKNFPVYPFSSGNPNFGEIYNRLPNFTNINYSPIEKSLEVNYGFKNLTILNTSGKVLLTINCEGKYQKIDLSHYINGVYLINLIKDNDEVISEKIIIAN